jgi:cobalamin biosynthesis protein CobD/CbiB
MVAVLTGFVTFLVESGFRSILKRVGGPCRLQKEAHASALRTHGRDQPLHADDIHDARQIVSEPVRREASNSHQL